MQTRIIGIGAAGNKAAITAVNDKVELRENVMLINSTRKDIPKDFQGNVHCFKDAYGGCGKERAIAKDLILNELKTGKLDLTKFLGLGEGQQTRAELVVLVSSTEGGTGSGSVPILARYIQEVLGIQTHCFAFTGFEEDARGLKNTLEYFEELKEDFTIQCVQNSKFLDDYRGDKIKAELAANAIFSRKIAVLFGNMIKDSAHNIDPTDLLKLSTTPGYMTIEYTSFAKVKNAEQFESIVQQMVDESKALDLNTKSQKKLGVIINIDEDKTGVIRYQSVLEEQFGIPYEKFEHIQHEEDMDEFIAIISAGSKVPIKEIQEIYDRYKERTSRVDKNRDNFFAKSQFNFDDGTSDLFDLSKKKVETVKKDDFFSNLENESVNKKKAEKKAGVEEEY